MGNRPYCRAASRGIPSAARLRHPGRVRAGGSASLAGARGLGAFAVAGWALTAADPAQACSNPSCASGEVFPFEGKVPSNALVWFVRTPRCVVCSPDGGVLEDQVTFARVGGAPASSGPAEPNSAQEPSSPEPSPTAP